MISNIGKNNTRIEAFDMTHDQNPLIPRDSLRVFNRKEHYGTSPSDSYPKYCIVHLDFLTKSHEKFDFTFSFLIKIASMFEVHLSRSAPSYWTPPGLSPNHRKETKLQCSLNIKTCKNRTQANISALGVWWIITDLSRSEIFNTWYLPFLRTLNRLRTNSWKFQPVCVLYA